MFISLYIINTSLCILFLNIYVLYLACYNIDKQNTPLKFTKEIYYTFL